VPDPAVTERLSRSTALDGSASSRLRLREAAACEELSEGSRRSLAHANEEKVFG